MDFPAIIEARIKELGAGSINQVEDTFGFRRGYLRGVLRNDSKRAIPSIEKARTICAALGLEFYIGPHRDTPDSPAINPAEDPSYRLVPYFDNRAAAGAGAAVEGETPSQEIAFRADWLSRQGISPSKSFLIKARGDSMEPKICDGDLLLVDGSKLTPPSTGSTSLHSRRPAPIYVIEQDGDLRVKYLRRPAPDHLILHSANTALYDPEILSRHDLSHLRILGQVVWWGHVAT